MAAELPLPVAILGSGNAGREYVAFQLQLGGINIPVNTGWGDVS